MANYAVPAPDDTPTGSYAVPAPDDIQPKATQDWQTQIKPVTTFNGRRSVQRPGDNAVWYGPEQGNTGQPGWFNSQGQRMGDAPGQGVAPESTLANMGKSFVLGAGAPLYAAAGHALSGFGLFPNRFAQAQTDIARQADQYRAELAAQRPVLGGLAGAAGEMGPGTAAVMMPAAMGGLPAATEAAVGMLPQASTALGRIGTSLAAGGIGGAMFAPVATAMHPTPEGQSFGEATLRNVPQMAAMGAAVPGGLSMIGEAPGAIGQGLRRALGTPVERQAALDLAQKIRTTTGAEPSLGESLQNPNLQHIENATEYIPFGGRGNQLKAANAAMQSVLQAETDAHVPALGATGAGDVISQSAKAGLAARRQPAIDLYNEVRNTIGNLESTTGKPFPPTVDHTLSAYDAAIAEETGISGADSPQVKLLQSERAKLASGETAPNYASLEKMQDRQQSQASNSYNAPSQEAQDVARYRARIGKAMGLDLLDTANAVDPKLGAKYQEANRIYSESYNYDPNAPTDWQGMKQRSMNRVLHGSEGATRSIPDNLLQGDNPDMASHAFDSLDENGRNAVKAEIWNRINQASNPVEAGGKSKGQVFSPLKAASAIDAHSNFIDKFFDQQEQDQIYGMRDAFRKMSRAGQYMEGISTGKFVPALAGVTGAGTAAQLALAGHPGLAALEGVPIGLARGYNVLSGSPGGKAWLLKPNAAPGLSQIFGTPSGAFATSVSGQIYRPTSQKEYDAIPSGATYQSISGTMGIKPTPLISQYDPKTGFEKYTTQDVDPKLISKGLIEKGNIPLVGRPLIPMGKGNVGSEYSYTIEDNGAHVLIPSIFDGAPHTAKQAIAHYMATGQHLGKWDTNANADAAAEIIHNRENDVLYRKPGTTP